MTAIQSLHKNDLINVMVLFARGYTIRYIRNYLVQLAAEYGRVDMVPTEQDLLKLAALYSDDIEKVRAELAKDTLSRGFARKEERILRLSIAAENIEPAALSGLNLKATEMYRRLIKDVAVEVEGLNIRILTPDDPWAQLLNNLKEKADSQETMPNTSLPTPPNNTLELDQVLTKSTQSMKPSPLTDTPSPTPDSEQFSMSDTDLF